MIPRQSLVVASRIINQIVRDKRTLALIIIAPLIIIALIGLSVPDAPRKRRPGAMAGARMTPGRKTTGTPR